MTSPAYTGWGECVNSGPSEIPRVIQRQQGRSSLEVFLDLYRHSDRNGRLELDARAVGARTGFSRKTVYQVVAFLQRVNLLFREEARTGRGQHSRYRVNWRDLKKCHPPKRMTSNGNTAFKDTPVSPRLQRTNTPNGIQERQETLDELPDHMILVRGARYWRYAMERVRTGAGRLGAERAVSDVIVGVLCEHVSGKPMREYRKIAAELNRRGAELVERVRAAWRRGRRAAYAACKAALARLLGGKPIHDREPGELPRSRAGEGGTATFDLTSRQGRRHYLDTARELARAGAACPRCGERLDRRLFRDDAAIAFREDGLCRCVYVAFDREALAREARWRRADRRLVGRMDGKSRHDAGRSRQRTATDAHRLSVTARDRSL